MASLYLIEIYPDAPIMIEIFLIGLALALLGALIYTLFISSMQDDHEDQWRKIARGNPWERLNVQNGDEPPKKPRRKKRFKIIIALLIIAVLALIFLILAI